MSNKVAYVKMRYFKLFSASITQHCDVYSHTAATKRQPSPSLEETDLKLFNFVLHGATFLLLTTGTVLFNIYNVITFKANLYNKGIILRVLT